MGKETVDVVTLEHSDMYTLGMYRIKEVAKKIKVVCEQCSARGYVANCCNKCGGKGVHNKTKHVWVVDNKLYPILKITRSQKKTAFSDKGDLLFWTSKEDFFSERSKLLHFSVQDALDECDLRNNLGGLK